MSDIEYRGLGIVELAKHALQKPDDFGWWGRDEMFKTWGWAGIDKNNASDAYAIVNFDVITENLISRFPDDFDIVGLRHWVVGHVDRLTCRVLKDEDVDITEENITDAFKAAMTWQMELEDYPLADDDRLYEYCENEMVEWIASEMPIEVYIAISKNEVAGQIIEEMRNDDNFDPVDWIVSGQYPDQDMIRHSAYNLNLCWIQHRDLWDEWVEEQGLPPILWGDEIGYSPNAIHKLHKINGQLNLFEE
jgi:hypothetical protein